jgi:hypothetical protein
MRNDAGYRFHMLISSNKPSIEQNNRFELLEIFEAFIVSQEYGSEAFRAP